jgi:hypothetical protein
MNAWWRWKSTLIDATTPKEMTPDASTSNTNKLLFLVASSRAGAQHLVEYYEISA